ncbi:hypothetical protein ACU8KH_05621 [Lachancea thermotolerans]
MYVEIKPSYIKLGASQHSQWAEIAGEIIETSWLVADLASRFTLPHMKLSIRLFGSSSHLPSLSLKSSSSLLSPLSTHFELLKVVQLGVKWDLEDGRNHDEVEASMIASIAVQESINCFQKLSFS